MPYPFNHSFRLILALSTIATASALHAQDTIPALPAWMQASFAKGSTNTLPAVVNGPVKHNGFIGSYRAKLSVTDTVNGITQHLYLSAWQDSTRGVMQLELFPGMPHTTWFADIEANMGVVANAIGRKAVVSDLQRVLLVDRLSEPGKLREFGPVPLIATGEVDEIAGQRCPAQLLIEGRDTMLVWTADVTPSPFVDGPAWIPLNEGPLKAFRFLWRFGDLVVFRFALEPLLTLEILEHRPGLAPPPTIALHGYEVIPIIKLASPVGRP
jgi:hypothetical protein